MTTQIQAGPIEAVESALRQLFRLGNLPRVRERFAARAGVKLDRASYSLIAPLEEEPMRISALAERSGVDVSTASRQIVQLERDGVVKRVRDEDDGRASILKLTALGKRQLARIAVIRQQIFAEVLSDFTDAETRQLAHLLERLNKKLTEQLEGTK